MNIPTEIASSDAITTDKEQFWKEHAQHQLESGDGSNPVNTRLVFRSYFGEQSSTSRLVYNT